MEKEIATIYLIVSVNKGCLKGSVIFSVLGGYTDLSLILKECYFLIGDEFEEYGSPHKLVDLASQDHKKYNYINNRNFTFSPKLERLEINNENIEVKITMTKEAVEGLKYLINNQSNPQDFVHCDKNAGE